MSGKIAIGKLKPHPKNNYYFTDISGEKYEEVKRSINVNGIRDPIKVTTSFTVISGHQRLRIAKELGMSEVPVEIIDVDEWQAEYLLIAENVERRGQAETDPIKKARIAQFLKEYWGVRTGRGGDRKSKDIMSIDKSIVDIAETLGESEKTTRRLMKLNDLIPQLQRLVSEKKLGTTAAEQLAYLSTEVQSALYETLGEEIGEKTVAEVKELRRELNETKAELQRTTTPKVEVKEVVKEVIPDEVSRKLADAERRIREVEKERDELDASLSNTYARIRDLERLERAVKSETESPLYDMYRSALAFEGYLQAFNGDIRLSEAVVRDSDSNLISKVSAVLTRIGSQVNQSKLIIASSTTAEIIEGEIIN